MSLTVRDEYLELTENRKSLIYVIKQDLANNRNDISLINIKFININLYTEYLNKFIYLIFHHFI